MLPQATESGDIVRQVPDGRITAREIEFAVTKDPKHPQEAAVGKSLRLFTGAGYDKGRSVLIQSLWFATMNLVFSRWWFPAKFRPWLLRLFGARIGDRVLIRHNVRVHWPWKLSLGNDVWIGEDAWLLNLEPIRIGNDVCVSQAAFLCTGSHDRRSPSFEFDNGPITIEDEAWVAARATILRGVTVGRRSVLGAGAVVFKDVPPGQLVVAHI